MFKYSHNHKKYFSKNGDKVTYEKGHLIVDKFSKSEYVFFLDEGIIKTSIRSRNDSLENIIGYFFLEQLLHNLVLFLKILPKLLIMKL